MIHQAPRLHRMALAAILVTMSASAALASGIPPIGVEVVAAPNGPIMTLGTLTGSWCNAGPGGGCESTTATAAYSVGNASVSGSGSTIGGINTPNTTGYASVNFFFWVG